MSKIIFISQPMAGKAKEVIKAERAELVDYLEKKGYFVLDSIVAKTPKEALNDPVYYLSESILLLSEADCVYFMPGWKDARGCKIEHTIAKEYGISIIKD
ncbi:MAG: DUF4406 domain-containing protein [Methanobacterium paludis]|nr:DUF4406 domain-containing protein [Methanobacterium paludis]